MDMIFTGTGEPLVRAMLDGRAGYTHVCGAPVPAAVAGRGLKILGAFQISSFGLCLTLPGSITRPALEIALRRHGISIDEVKR